MKISSPVIMAYPNPPRRASGLVRYVFMAIVIILTMGYLRRYHTLTAVGDSSKYVPSLDTKPPPTADGPAAPQIKPETKEPETPIGKPKSKGPTSTHPIDELIEGAEKSFADLLKKESKDLKSAAAEYRKRRGRHPPPGFDTWFKFAQDNGAVMVEDFFDQIYHDLGPFWGLPASTMRKEAWNYEMTIHVRGHNASCDSDWFWAQIWLNMTKTIEHMLPDTSLAVNAMDEPRIVAPWEEIDKYMEIERSTRSFPRTSEVITEFQKLEKPGKGPDKDVTTRPKNWEDTRKLEQTCFTLIC
jgi:hypothetical protein